MAELVNDFHDPSLLAGFLQDTLLLPSEDATSETQFPNSFTDSIDFESNAADIKDYGQTAEFRAYGVEAAIGRRRTGIQVRGNLPPLALKFLLGEKELARLRNGEIPQSIVQRTFNDAVSGLDATRKRLEILRIQCLADGAISLAEGGVQLDVDFGRNAATQETTAGVSWDAAGATPLNDEMTVMEDNVDRNGVAMGVAYASSRVIKALLTSEEYRNNFPTNRVAPQLTLGQVNQVRTTFDLPPIVRYNNKLPDGTRVLPDDVILHAPAGPVGATVWGVPSMANVAGVTWAAEVGGPVAYQMRDLDPYTMWTSTEAIAFPVLANPDFTAKTTVLF